MGMEFMRDQVIAMRCPRYIGGSMYRIFVRYMKAGHREHMWRDLFMTREAYLEAMSPKKVTMIT